MDTLWFNIVQWLHTLGLHVDGGTARAVVRRLSSFFSGSAKVA